MIFSQLVSHFGRAGRQDVGGNLTGLTFSLILLACQLLEEEAFLFAPYSGSSIISDNPHHDLFPEIAQSTQTESAISPHRGKLMPGQLGRQEIYLRFRVRTRTNYRRNMVPTAAQHGSHSPTAGCH